MSPISQDTQYPIAIFLIGPYASPATLQNLLQTPIPPKLRKAILVGYAASSDPTSSAVTYDGRKFGTWEDEDEGKGVVYMLASLEEKENLRLVDKERSMLSKESL
jgi:hypothetical protein